MQALASCRRDTATRVLSRPSRTRPQRSSTRSRTSSQHTRPWCALTLANQCTPCLQLLGCLVKVCQGHQLLFMAGNFSRTKQVSVKHTFLEYLVYCCWSGLKIFASFLGPACARLGKTLLCYENGAGAQAALLDRLLKICPSQLTRFFFANSGSEAIDNAIKIARAHTGKQNIICFEVRPEGWCLGQCKCRAIQRSCGLGKGAWLEACVCGGSFLFSVRSHTSHAYQADYLCFSAFHCLILLAV